LGSAVRRQKISDKRARLLRDGSCTSAEDFGQESALVKRRFMVFA
jgi:hypothetical protein